MNSTTVRRSVYRAILKHTGDVFKTRDIREELGWAEDSSEGRRLHAIIQSLKQQGVIAQTGPARKRHQHLELRKPDELRAEMERLRVRDGRPRVPTEEAAMSGSGPRRVRYLEERVEELENGARSRDGKLEEIVGTLSDMNAKLDALYNEWVGDAA